MTITGSKKVKPRVGISQCLLGDRVRYDGRSKPLDESILHTLQKNFELIPVCPEVEAGLSTPRPPVQLTGTLEMPRLTGRDDPTLDVTEQLRQFSGSRTKQLSDLSGYIFKSRSPSCGLNSTPVFSEGRIVTENSRGIFAHTLLSHYPELPVTEDSQLDEHRLAQFILQVQAYHTR